MQNIAVLGSTGSIGKSTLDVIARHPERFKVHALTAHSNAALLAQQCQEFHPAVVAVGTPAATRMLTEALQALSPALPQADWPEILTGSEGIEQIAADGGSQTVMAAIVGAAGLAPTLAAVRAGKKILLANKEALVMSGQLMMDAVKAHGATLLPVDSEHNAIFQSLPTHFEKGLAVCGIHKIVLTASGGPFLNRSLASLEEVTPEQAVAHPNWVMGRKISVDSATMMNKGLEVIEARWLFDATPQQIDVVIHPQSVIHSMVSYVDGSTIAQLGNPDMRTPIAHALAWPERIEAGVPPLDLCALSALQFVAPDFKRFSCLQLAYDALSAGGSAAAILNAANEVAVAAFLAGRIGFRDIDRLNAMALERIPAGPVTDIESVIAIDQHTRQLAETWLAAGLGTMTASAPATA